MMLFTQVIDEEYNNYSETMHFNWLHENDCLLSWMFMFRSNLDFDIIIYTTLQNVAQKIFI